MKTDARERLTWLASGVLVAAWLLAFLANYGIRNNIWFVAPVEGIPLVQQYAVLAYGAVLILIAAVLAWVLYSSGLADARRQAELERRFRKELEDVHRGTLQALTMALDVRDGETLGHSRRVMGYSLVIGEQMGLNSVETETLAWGALLHDLGKIGIRDSILLKPGPLTPEEWVEMQRHVILGYEMVQQIPFLARTAAVLRHHHEKYDGSGYPDHLAGEQIPLLARVFAVADAFDAMTSARPYRAVPKSMAEARAVIQKEAGKHFCPAVAEAFSAVPVEKLEQIVSESFLPLVEMDALFRRDGQPQAPSADYYRDPLTGTSNRTAWEAKQSHMMLAKGLDLGVVAFLDVDGLKKVNDTFGHLMGDRMLADLGARLSQLGTEIYRVGGDEFVLWSSGERWRTSVEMQLQPTLDQFADHWTALGPKVAVSWGATAATTETKSMTELLEASDTTMYDYKLRRRRKASGQSGNEVAD